MRVAPWTPISGYTIIEGRRDDAVGVRNDTMEIQKAKAKVKAVN
jgi:hypothetical protein